MEDTRVTAIVEALTEKTYVHGHGIGRKEAKLIGLQVEYMDGEVADAVWNLFKDYEEALKLNANRDLEVYFEEYGPDIYTEPKTVVACIESAKSLHACTGELRLKRIRKVPPQPTINLNLNVSLPPNIRPEELPQQLRQALQQIQQDIVRRIRAMVEQEIIRQSPIQGIEGGLRGGQWELVE